MKKILVEVYGKHFDLNNLEPLVTAIGYNPAVSNDVGFVGESLYKTADGQYFLASEYGSWVGEDFFGGGDWRDEVVCDESGNPWAVPVTEAEAKGWAECVFIDADDFARIFGEESKILREGEKLEEEMRELRESQELIEELG